MSKFFLIALPGAGKTTTLQACVNYLKKQGMACNFISTDALINQRINANDKIVQAYEQKHGIEISSEVFDSKDPMKAFMKIYGESALQELEESLLVNIVDTATENDWFDLGGRAFKMPRVMKALADKKIIPVLLDAKPETINTRLAKDEGWRQRPSYAMAAEQSIDGQGWKINAENHRKERLEQLRQSAAIVVSAEKVVLSKIVYKTPEEIVCEIFEKIEALRLEVLSSANAKNSKWMRFFTDEYDGNLAHREVQDNEDHIKIKSNL